MPERNWICQSCDNTGTIRLVERIGSEVRFITQIDCPCIEQHPLEPTYNIEKYRAIIAEGL